MTTSNDAANTTTEEVIKLFLPSVLGYEKIARGAAEAVAQQLDVKPDRIEDLKTAVAEACMNAIEHGNALERTTMVSVLINPGPEKIEVRVADVGRQVVPETLPEPGSGDMRGWGFFFIQRLVDEMEITQLPNGGNQVRMVIYLTPPTPQSASETTPAAETAQPAASSKPAAPDKAAPDMPAPSPAEPQVKEDVPAPPADRALQAAAPQRTAIQPVEPKPGAIQPAEEKPGAIQPAEDKPSAIQPAGQPVTSIQAADDSPSSRQADPQPPEKPQAEPAAPPAPQTSDSETPASSAEDAQES